MPKIVGDSVRVVDTGLLSIDEYAGNVGSKDDRISIAVVKVNEPTCEPWLTLHYDEWMCVTKGRMVLNYGEGSKLEVREGQTVFIEKGERFQPTFPDGGTEYLPVCLPAFRPDRCIREDEPDSEVSKKLATLHDGYSAAATSLAPSEESSPEVLYHMCQQSLWEEAKAAGTAYFPPTFDADGFTHATAVPSRLLETANHFYQDVSGSWVCLRFRRSALLRLGIVTKDEKAMPVGQKDVGGSWSEWICPHVVGGISPQVVEAEFPMLRDGSAYTSIQGLTDIPRIFKLATAAESTKFRKVDRIESELDTKDGFVHLSDRNSAPFVAKHFFKGCADLRLFELDANLLPGTSKWIVGKRGDPEPDAETRSLASTVVQYTLPEGCVHVFGTAGVPCSAIMREEAVPLGENGLHSWPAWL